MENKKPLMTSERLEDLCISFDELGYEPSTLCNCDEEIDYFKKELKNTRLEFAELERFTKLIVKKTVDVNELRMCHFIEDGYNRCLIEEKRLTREDVNLIKGMIKKYE